MKEISKYVTLALFCDDFDVAKNFYVTYLNFKTETDKIIKIENIGFRRVILIHKFVDQLKIEFFINNEKSHKKNVEEKNSTINLFNISCDNIDELFKKLSIIYPGLQIIETPFANFLTITDPMGNKIGLHQNS